MERVFVTLDRAVQAALQDAEARSGQLHMQLLAAATREEELVQVRRAHLRPRR